MTKAEFQQQVKGLPVGKRLPNAVYFLRELNDLLTPGLRIVIQRAAELHDIDGDFNIVKFNLESFAISFLSYPAFWDDPHPVLKSVVLVDLLSGRAKRQEFSDRSNPPILHRKETFLPESHPMRQTFANLTREEENAGLYRQTSTIGFQSNWDQLLAALGLSYEGHHLVSNEVSSTGLSTGESAVAIPVDRHRTAISRLDLSRPVKTALETGLLESGRSFFDFGCGQGEDVDGLVALGYQAKGWDPVYRPREARDKADIVNLGYVLNVIEDPAERIETLASAWDLAKTALVITALTKGTAQSERSRAFGDGVLTQRNTFQKFFDHTELQFIIEEALGSAAVPLGLGMFAVFREIGDREDFFERKSRRSFDWQVVAQRLRAVPRVHRARDIYCENEQLLVELWQHTVFLGRPPASDELERSGEVKRACGSLRSAHRLLLERHGTEALQEASKHRKEDLLVYLALAKFGARRVSFAQLSVRMRRSIKAFFGSYAEAVLQATQLLYTAGKADVLEACVNGLDYGWFDAVEGHFSFHRSLLEALPAVLRIYVGCGSQLYGDIREADLIKIHLRSQKLTCTFYEQFDRRRFPTQLLRVKIDFGRLDVREFSAPQEPYRQVLLFKERYLSKDHKGYGNMLALSKRLRALGLDENKIGHGIEEHQLQAFLAQIERRR